ncbi:MAG TPA: HAD family hydrolase [Longimicrobium sp.]|jgi:HAD superfamily hydrolase (TIGR01509 family)
MTVRAAILDIDGTLIDSNDAHAQAWVDVGKEMGFDIEFGHVRRLIGMGGDKVLPELTGLEDDSDEAEKVKKRRGEIFRERYLPSLQPFPQARELLERFQADGMVLVVATSASKDDMGKLLEKAGIKDLIEEKTSQSDVEASKPDPDVIEAAVEKAGCKPSEAVMLGDTPYDVEAARRAGVPCVALRCGGWDDEELSDAVAIYDDPADLLANYAESPYSRG